METTNSKTTVEELARYAKAKAAEAAETAGSAVRDIGRRAEAKAEEARTSAADNLGRAASVLHEKADRVAETGHAAAAKVGAAGDYFRESSVSSISNDVRELVRRNPGTTLFLAVMAGIFVGRALARDRA